ncbi:unnamed protein product [Adineta ricciae]|uniref:Uncharacterized protein n=1 Tax=Adineta ricciae TaxID=249248 RepID=A0A814JGA6_ADIRI|nr:unnamed protein product [Adineta ricciae]CAF1374998.1 unnamed protein product [Adineta ricciae]
MHSIIISNTSLSLCLTQPVEYVAPGKPFHNYTKYLIDGKQGSTVTHSRAGILKDYGATAGIQCRGSGTMTVCFSHA